MWNVDIPTLLPVCRNNFQLGGNLAGEPVNLELPEDKNLTVSCVHVTLITHAAGG